MNKSLVKKYFKGARTACGWLLGYYGFVAIYNLIMGLTQTNERALSMGLIAIVIGSTFFWLVRRLHKEFTFRNIVTIFLAFFGYAMFNLGSFVTEEEYSKVLIKLAIYVPILFFLGRGLKASACLEDVKE